MAAAKKKGCTAVMVGQFVANVVTATVLAYLIGLTGLAGLGGGLTLGFLVWLGFLATNGLGSMFWEGKPFALYALNTGHHLVSYLVLGGIIGWWG